MVSSVAVDALATDEPSKLRPVKNMLEAEKGTREVQERFAYVDHVHGARGVMVLKLCESKWRSWNAEEGGMKGLAI